MLFPIWLTGQRVPFFTALGRDRCGAEAAERLDALGLELHVAWRDAPTRRGITFIDASGERTITVIGERLAPLAADPLPWQELAAMDGVFATATDAAGLARRAAPVLAKLSPVEVHGLEDAAEIADRVRFGLGVGDKDVEVMQRFAAWAIDTVWERLGDGEQVRCMYREL